jgi:hypothetical protein
VDVVSLRPKPIPTLPPVGGISLDPGKDTPSLQSQPPSGDDARLLAKAIAGSVVTAVVLSGIAWYARRRRAQPSRGAH